MCQHQITVTNNNKNNMEEGHGTNLGRLPREPRLQPLLEPLLPGKANKRKRLNAVLDKLANNIKVAPESPDDEGDNNLEFEINVKTKIKKESDPSSESEESDNERRNVEMLSDTDRSPRSSVSDTKDDIMDSPGICLSPNHIRPEPEKSFSKNIFFNNSPPSSSSQKLQESQPDSPTPSMTCSPTPSLMSSYEQYIKSQLLSKMYLQQYMSNNLTNCTKTDQLNPSQSKVISQENSGGHQDHTHQGGHHGHHGHHQVLLDGPLDLSTRQTDSLAIVTKDSLAQSLKERLYCQQFPFPPFPPLLMQNSVLHSRSQDETLKPSKIKQESPAVVETSSIKKDPAYVCPICGQMFSLHDRLAKHMASRHKSKASDASSKAYFCDVCKRSFARSDMLTRHMRLHTGIKPYTCRVCGQVFSRSDHLSTHQRTHTGEKPYKCPSCPYSACRRDMITRHMRTHSRYELQDSSSTQEDSEKESNGHVGANKNISGEAFKFVKEEIVDS